MISKDWEARAVRMTQRLIDAGHLADPAWREAFLAVPRHVFVPDRPLDEVYADDVVLTQTRTATFPSGGTVEVPTSSSSAPSVMALMLERLDPREGMAVLEIGVGTGYNAALLCHRLGDRNITSVDIDPGLVDTARGTLGQLNYQPTLAVADGYQGYPLSAPYDRIIATCAITRVPPGWIRQLTPGGRIVAPLRMDGYPLAVLDKTADDEVTGRIDSECAAFMPLRHKVDSPLLAGSVIPDLTTVGHYGTTDVDPAPLADAGLDLRLFLALHIPDVSLATTEDEAGPKVTFSAPNGHADVWLGPDESGRWTVIQHGWRIWDSAEHALRTWEHLGRPSRSRYGISALDHPDRQYVWLDDPNGQYAWPLG